MSEETNVAAALTRLLPMHEASLSLTHNEHKDYYLTVEEWDEHEVMRGTVPDWVSTDQRQKAMAKNEMWCLHWYPDTPIGFHRWYAADLGALLEFVVATGNENGTGIVKPL